MARFGPKTPAGSKNPAGASFLRGSNEFLGLGGGCSLSGNNDRCTNKSMVSVRRPLRRFRTGRLEPRAENGFILCITEVVGSTESGEFHRDLFLGAGDLGISGAAAHGRMDFWATQRSVKPHHCSGLSCGRGWGALCETGTNTSQLGVFLHAVKYTILYNVLHCCTWDSVTSTQLNLLKSEYLSTTL